MTNTNDTASYDINFFKPKDNIAKENNLVIALFIIFWAVAVFGFQFLLIATNQMVKEDSLIAFEEAWPQVQSGEASVAEYKVFSRSLLMVLGKNIALSNADKAVLKSSLNLTLIKIDPEANMDQKAAADVIGLQGTGFDQLMIELLPYSLGQPADDTYDESLPAIMGKYATHPRGPLTDFTFLGFPFHYWYTAQFLLIIFVLLCLTYAIKIEKIHAKHKFVESHE